MSVEEDIARIDAVTERLAGPQKVWVLTSTWIEKKAIVHPSVHTSKEHALSSFRNSLAGSWEGVYETQEEVDEVTNGAVKELENSGEYEDGDVTWNLDERELLK